MFRLYTLILFLTSACGTPAIQSYVRNVRENGDGGIAVERCEAVDAVLSKFWSCKETVIRASDDKH